MMEKKKNIYTEHGEIIYAKNVEVKEIKWLWYGYIPFGKITLLQGDPGDGKSSFILKLAAMLTTGTALPFTDEALPPMNVIYQSTEDDVSDSVIPKFIKAGGDTERLLYINEKEKALSFSDERIAEAIKAVDAKLLILDPLSSYIGNDVALNCANEVRSRFNNLINIAQETGCAIVIVCHLNKVGGTKAVYRTVGSIDIVGAARSTLLIARTDSDKPDERVMVVQKSNVAETGHGIKFSIHRGEITWLEEVAMTADEALSAAGGKPGRPNEQVQRAIGILDDILDDEPIKQTDIMEAMDKAKIGRSTAIKAKNIIGAVSKKIGSVWYWTREKNEAEECINYDFEE